MPELGPKNLAFTKEIKENLTKRIGKLLEIVEDYDQTWMGYGEENIVVSSKDSPEKVTAFYYQGLPPFEAKKIFYLQRIFSTLFPHNFPHFYAASGGEKNQAGDTTSGTVRQRITRRSFGNFLDKTGITNLIPAKYPFSKVRKVSKELGIDLREEGPYLNFRVGADGGEYYTDTIKDSNIEEWDIEKIMKYMKDQRYSPEEIKIVELSMKRLKKLDEQSEQ